MLEPRVIVCGSRGWHDRQRIADWLADYVIRSDTVPVIVVGYNPVTDTPKGADRLAYQEAQKLGHPIECHPAMWQEHGKSAGFIRNEEMAAAGAVLCVAFWDGRSNGTRHMMERAHSHEIPVEQVLSE